MLRNFVLSHDCALRIWVLKSIRSCCVPVFLLIFAACTQVPRLHAQGNVTVDVTSGHALNSFNPGDAFGVNVDGQPISFIGQLYTTANVNAMKATGDQAMSYRLKMDLAAQAWSWNPTVTWSDPSNGGQGYFVGSTALGSAINHSYSYRFPHRGETFDNGENTDYSRLDDGDYTTYWKSNPYLDTSYTGDPNSSHPQWVLVDLGAVKSVNAVKLTWANPYATQYGVQYWNGPDAVNAPDNGIWVTFPSGSVSNGTGGTVTLNLGGTVSMRYLRVLMSASSNTCDTHGSADPRDCVGYALFEIGVGTLSGSTFTDLVNHVASQAQSTIYVSSQDSWSNPSYYANVATRDIEQPGLDMIFTNGLTFGNPMMVPVAILYGTPENAVAEITYLKNRGYAISRVELGEEPDGQSILPEDYAALYLQWATALHALDPNLKLGGPTLQGVFYPGAATLSSCLANPVGNGHLCENATWPDASGETRWMARFINYLKSHNRLSDLAWLDVEHYPFSNCGDSTATVWSNIVAEPSFIKGLLQLWQADGAPAGIPTYITEYNYSAFPSQILIDIPGAAWQADFVGSSLTAGVKGVFYYTGETSNLGAAGCTYGAMSKLQADATYNQFTDYFSVYFSNILLTQQWAQMGNSVHQVYPATSNILDGNGNVLVTAYPLLRPDGQWAVLLVNKDNVNAHSLTVTFNDASTGQNKFLGAPTMTTFGPGQYVWHANRLRGYPSPDGPALTTNPPGGSGAVYTVPAASVVVLRGSVGPDFSLTAAPSSQTVAVGKSTTYTATVSPLNGFTGTVSLSVSGLPSGATGTFNPTSISGGSGSSTLTVLTASSMPTGTYTLTITGTSGSLAHTANVTLLVNPAGTPVYQINSGGPAVAPFAADAYFTQTTGSTGSTTNTINTSGVTNPAPMAVYQTERWGAFTYTFPNLTAGASYTVRLHFAEFYWSTTGQRIFNVAINGTTVLSNFDIIAAAGGPNIAIVKQFTATADSNGKITIAYTPGSADDPKSSGIEILQ